MTSSTEIKDQDDGHTSSWFSSGRGRRRNTPGGISNLRSRQQGIHRQMGYPEGGQDARREAEQEGDTGTVYRRITVAQ